MTFFTLSADIPLLGLFQAKEEIILGYKDVKARNDSNICKNKQRHSACRNNRRGLKIH